jgi:long-chain acyl-CoA synthetase
MAVVNLAGLVRSAAEAQPDKLALIDGERSISWAELDAQIDRLAAGLRSTGRADRARVGILLPNSVEFVIAYFGVLRADLVVVPLNLAYTAAELGFQITDADVSLVITDVERAETVREAAAIPLVTIDGDADGWSELLAAGEAGAVEPATGGDELAVLLYTSGTSGRPRGAMLSHRAMLGNLEQLSRIDPPVVASDDRVLLVLPLFHVYGLNAGLGMVARSAATGVLAQRFDPVETLAVVRNEHVSCIVGAPPMFVAWSMLPDLGESLSSVRLALSGAAPLPPAVLTAVLESSGHHIFEGYGLTETAPVLTTTLCSQVAKPGSVGKPVPGVELKLLVEPEEDDGDGIGSEDPGEVAVRGANLFSGYWPDGEGGPDDDGWWRTGDIGYVDADGDLFLVDRTRDLILVSGFNVYPREVEEVLRRHPAVEEVAVIGVPHPYTGETVKALVVLKPEQSEDADGLIDFAASSLARFKCPTTIEFVSELPHSLTGKVAKGRLRESARSAS